MRKYDDIIKEALDLFNKGDLEGSSKKYEEAFINEIHLDDLIMLGYIYIDLKKYNNAEEVFEVVMNEDNLEAYYGFANIYERTGKEEKAIEMYKKVVDIDPNFARAYFSLAYLYDDISETMKNKFEDSNVQEAIKYYNEAIKYENNYWAYLNLGSIYERHNHNEEAKVYFEKAYEINPSGELVSYNLGVVCSKLGQGEEALKHYLEEASKEKPYDSTYYNLGVLYKDYYKDYDKSKQCYLKSIADDSTHYNSWYNLGCIYALKKDYQNAYDCFKYLYYKKRHYVDFLMKDVELEEFRKSDYYLKLIKPE